MRANITVATAIWEKTYPYMLGRQGLLARNLALVAQDSGIHTWDPIVAVNNGVPRDVLQQYIPGEWVRYIASEVAVPIAMKRYGIKQVEDGFWYSAGPLTAIAMCHSPYLLYIADDVELVWSVPGWITDAIARMEVDPTVFAVSPLWHKPPGALLREHPDNHVDVHRWIKTRGFSDHCFLIRTADFQQDIYNWTHAESDARYPVPGAFEQRIGAYMAQHGLWRLVCTDAQWAHESYATTGNPRPEPTI